MSSYTSVDMFDLICMKLGGDKTPSQIFTCNCPYESFFGFTNKRILKKKEKKRWVLRTCEYFLSGVISVFRSYQCLGHFTCQYH